MTKKVILFGLLLLWCVAASTAHAWYPLLASRSILSRWPEPEVIGKNRVYVLGPGETLMEVAQRAGIGYQGIVQANPGLDPWRPGTSREIIIPRAGILPPESGLGITINLPELRLYYVWKESGRYRVRIYPIGIGREGWRTPEGLFEVLRKIEEPTWRVPMTIRQENPELPEYVPPGPDNPLGHFWVGLSAGKIGLHGTNRPFGVGRRISHGCIRLYPEDIKNLFARVSRKTPVRIIYRPVKLAEKDGQLFIEVHPDYLERLDLTADAVLKWPALRPWKGRVNTAALGRALQDARGIPVSIVLQEKERR
jgi:L,D-transpeptidase ErfK/SrfK